MKKSLTTVLLIASLSLLLAGCEASRQEPPPPSPQDLPPPSPAVRVSPAEASAAEPAIAADAEGNVYVLYVEHGADKTADVYLQKFTGEAEKAGERVRINPEQGRATAWRGDAPTVKIDGRGTIYVGWTARVEAAEGGGANDLDLSVSRDGGKSFGAPVKVNDDQTPGAHGMHSLEVDANGRIYFAWLDERYLKNAVAEGHHVPARTKDAESGAGEMKHEHAEPNREVYFAASTDGGKSFSANKKIAENVCPCCKTSLTVAPDGKLFVSWRQVLEGDFRHIAVSSSVDGGGSFAAPSVVSDDRWRIAGCPVSGAAITADSANNLKVVWFTAGDAGTPGVYQAESKDGGKSFSPRALVSDKRAGGTPVVARGENGNSRVIFSADDGNTYSWAVQNASAGFAENGQINDAELPGAVISKDQTFIAFIRKAGEKRGIFLSKQK